MKKLILLPAALATLGVSSLGQAAVTFTFLSKGTPVIGTASNPTTVTGYTAYIVEVTSTGLPIGGVDAGSNSAGFTGPLIERGTASGADGNYDTFSINDSRINNATSNLNLDSHLLAPVTQNPGAAPITASNGGATSVGNYVGQIGFGESLGTNSYAASGTKQSGTNLPTNTDSSGFAQSSSTGYLRGTFGIAAAAQSTVFDIAYFVVPTGTPIGVFNYDFIVATNDGTQYRFTSPEPTSFALLSLCSVHALRRQRRR